MSGSEPAGRAGKGDRRSPDEIRTQPDDSRAARSGEAGRRARETAEIVGARIGLAPRLDQRLREANRGDWEGRRFIDIEREEPERYAAWRRAGERFRFPGGESLLEQQRRVSDSLDEIHRQGLLPALVVCHGGSIRVTLCSRDPRGLDAFHEFVVPNVAVLAL